MVRLQKPPRYSIIQGSFASHRGVRDLEKTGPAPFSNASQSRLVSRVIVIAPRRQIWHRGGPAPRQNKATSGRTGLALPLPPPSQPLGALQLHCCTKSSLFKLASNRNPPCPWTHFLSCTAVRPASSCQARSTLSPEPREVPVWRGTIRTIGLPTYVIRLWLPSSTPN